jgi:hypothetical protein
VQRLGPKRAGVLEGASASYLVTSHPKVGGSLVPAFPVAKCWGFGCRGSFVVYKAFLQRIHITIYLKRTPGSYGTNCSLLQKPK